MLALTNTQRTPPSQRLVVVVSGVDTLETLERWQVSEYHFVVLS